MKETEDQRKGGTLVKDLTGKVCEVRSEGAGSTDVWKRKLTTYSGKAKMFLEPRRWAL